MEKIYFETKKYGFRLLIEEFLACTELEKIHLVDRFEKQLTSSEEGYGDQKQKLHRMFYDKLDVDVRFINTYEKFIKEVIKPLFQEEIYYQRYPTFRIHQPDNICVFKWHRDKDFGHNEKEINFFMPLTKAYDSNTIWVEKLIGAGEADAEPLEADYGELIQWYGAKFYHGNKNNNTGKTRISFDFRVLMKRDFDDSQAGVSLTRKTKFSPENYFSSIE